MVPGTPGAPPPDADEAPRALRRRWPQRLLVGGSILVLLVVAALACAPMCGLRYLSGMLPWTWRFHGGAVVVERLDAPASQPTDPWPGRQLADQPSAHLPGPLAEAPLLEVTCPEARLISVARTLSGYWLPNGLLRTGTWASGRLTLDDPELALPALSWWARLLPDAPVQVRAQVPASVLARLLAQQQAEIAGGGLKLTCAFAVDSGTIRADDPPGHPRLERRLAVTARGRIRIASADLGMHRTVDVTRLSGHAWWTFAPVPGGLSVRCRVAIEAVDADLFAVPLLASFKDVAVTQLEAAANNALADCFTGLVLPSWAPVDVACTVAVIPLEAGALGPADAPGPPARAPTPPTPPASPTLPLPPSPPPAPVVPGPLPPQPPVQPHRGSSAPL